MQLLFVSALVFAGFTARAQNYRWQWANPAGTAGAQTGNAVASDAAGNVYVTGSISQNGNTFGAATVSSYGGQDIFVAKYNNAGTLLWVQHAGSLFDDEGKGIAVDANGDVYVTGYFNSIAIFSGTISLITVGNQDIFLAKLDGTDGSILWAKGAGGLGADIGYAVTTTGSLVYVAGSFSGLSNFGLFLETSGGQTDAFVAAYTTANGTETWVRSGGTSRADVTTGLASDASGVYACGYYGDAAATFQNISGSLANIGEEDIFLVKYNPAGNGLWKKSAGNSTSDDEATSICLSGASLYLAGYFQGTINFFNVPGPSSYAVTAAANEDGLLASYNTGTGNINWAVTTGGTNSDRANGVIVNTVGDVFVTGSFKNALPGPALTASGGNDVFVLKYNTAGVLQSGVKAGGASDEFGYGICANGISGVFVTGSFLSGTAAFSSNTITNAGNEDIFIAQTTCSAIAGTASALSTIACNHDSTTVFLNGSTGTIQWQYSPATLGTWTTIPGATNDTARVPVLNVSDYRAVVTFNGCAPAVSNTLTVNNYPVPVAAAGTDQFTCFATAALAGNNPPVGSGTWLSLGSATVQSPGNFNSAVNGLTTGANFFVWRVTDAICTVSAADTVKIFVYTTPTITASASPDTICAGTSTTLTASGAATYVWNPGSINGSNVVVSPGTTTTYNVTGTSADGCAAVTPVTVHVDALPVFSVSVSDAAICAGFSTTLTTSGSAVSYNWMPGNFNTAAITVTPAATTTYTVTGINGTCAVTHVQTIMVNTPPPVAAGASPDTICFGAATVLSGSGAATLVWMPGNLNGANQTVAPPTTTTYTLTGTDVNGCVDSAQQRIVVNPLPVVSADANPAVICEGQTTTLSASGGTNYVWNGGTLTNASGAAQTDAPVTSVTYSVVITNNFGCVDSATVPLTVNPLPAVSAGNDTTICSGNPVVLHAAGGTSWSWNGGALVNAAGATQTVTPLSTITYVVTATTGAGCSANDTVTAFVNTTSVANAGNDTTICSGNPVTLNGTGGTSWTWNGGALVNVSGAMQTVTPAATTIYVLTAATSAGCSATDSVTVFVNTTPVANAGNDTTICSGNPVSLNGTGGTSWTWNGGALVNANGAVQTVTPSVTTIYVLTAATSAGCAATDSVTVFVNITPVANAGNDTTICSEHPALLQASGGDSWTWNGGTLMNANGALQTVTPLVAATYTVTAVTIAGCSSIDSITVFVNTTPVAFAGNDTTICPGNAVLLNGTGGDSWTWNGGSLVNANGAAQTVVPSVTTTYVLTAATFAGCSATDSITVFVNATPVANAGNDTTICSENPALLQASGGDSWTWNGGALVNASGALQTVTPLIATTYTVTAASIAGCSSIDSITVFVNTTPVAFAGNDTTICSGNAVLLNGTGGDSWTWNGGSLVNANGATQTVVPSVTTTYVLTAATFAGCSSTDSITVFVNTTPVANAGNDTTICSGNPVTLNGTGGTSWTWNGGVLVNANGTTQTVSPLVSTTYTVTAATSAGCSSIDSIIVFVNTTPVVFAGNDTTVCSGDKAWLNATGGNSWNWNGGSLVNAGGATQAVVPLSTTTYTVTATSAAGCAAIDSVTVNVNPLPLLSAGADTSLCSGDTIQLHASGAGSFLWTPTTALSNNSIADPFASPTVTSTYAVTLMDANGCTSTDTIGIVVFAVPVPSTSNDTLVCTGSSCTIVANGGTAYQWNGGTLSNAPGASQLVNPATSTTYSVLITSANGCTAADSVTISVDQLPSVASAGTDAALCATSFVMNANNPASGTGMWNIVTSAGVPANSSQHNTSVSGLSIGQNVFEWVITSGVCPASRDTVVIHVDQPASAAVAGPDLNVCSDSVYMQALVPAVGTGAWTNISAAGNFVDLSSGQSLVTNLTPGSFQYVWTVTNGVCSSAPDTVTVTAYAMPSVATAGPDQLVYTTAVTMNAAVPSSGAGTWTRISGSGILTGANDPAATVTQLEVGTSVFRWTVSNGTCAATFDDVQITREASFIPTGFSPNGDGVNDFFVIPGIESFSLVTVRVFNRWGNSVYASDDYRNDWDGTRIDGEKLPEDVYYYVIDLGDGNEVAGYVALKRSQP